MGSVAMYIPSFIKISSGIQKIIGGGDSRTHRQHVDRIVLFKESWLRMYEIKPGVT
jgi:hypothetical protein